MVGQPSLGRAASSLGPVRAGLALGARSGRGNCLSPSQSAREGSWESGKRLKQRWQIGIMKEIHFLGILHCLARREMGTKAPGRIYCFALSSCKLVPDTPSALPGGFPSLQLLHNPFYPTFTVKTLWSFIA